MKNQNNEIYFEETYSKILRINDEEIKEMALWGFLSKVDENRKEFNTKYKLDYDYDYFNRICNDVLTGIFSFSPFIHSDVLFRMVKRIATIERKDNWIFSDDTHDADIEFIREIIKCIMQEMESLYKINKDEIFNQLVNKICDILKLDVTYK